MPRLMKAYKMAENLRRNPKNVIPFKVAATPVTQSEFGDNLIVIEGEVEGSQHPYKCLITLPNNGAPLLEAPLTPEQLAEARWWCSCDDFRFTFHPHIDAHGDALRAFPEYVPNGRGQPRAIADYGMCKHLMAVCDQLVAENVMPSITE